jgi:hypothetical protein
MTSRIGNRCGASAPRRTPVLVIVLAALLLPIGPPAIAAVRVRDVGERLDLPRTSSSWSIAAGDIDADGVADLAISYHSSVVFYRNTRPGLEEMFTQPGGDPHGCAIGDVEGNGLGDVYCTRGAGRGTIQKANRLWIQTAPGVFEDRAESYGVEDPYGRGRRTTFVDIDHEGSIDLFVGNGAPRQNEFLSPNRTFLGSGSTSFTEEDLGLTAERGAECVQRVDQNRDDWDDLLVCGRRRLFLYRNEGGTSYQNVAGALGIAFRHVRSAWLTDLNKDERSDLITVTRSEVRIHVGIRGARFGRLVYSADLRAGTWVAVGDIDGRRGQDLLVVQACDDDVNVSDRLLLNRRVAWSFRRVRIPQARRGCGDVATAIDLNEDGRDEFVVLNGRPVSAGPVQVLTTRWV